MEFIKEAVSLLVSGDREIWQIIGTTLVMSVFSTGISAVLGIALGVLIGKKRFRGKGILLRITNTLMGLPPVVAGLLVFVLFRGVGPFGSLHLMFSVPIMVIAQVLLITPVVTGLSAAAAGERGIMIAETARGIGLSGAKQTLLLVRECAPQFVSIILVGFGRSIAEVGAVSLVGGNIQFKTRVMTTAILLESNKGNFEKAFALGVVLMLLSLLVNIPAYRAQEKMR
ncbi:MAG: ABC transporter permease [Clostridia bacterium]|nr:ABC transporter permease [Clostridia bacterium]